MSAPTSIQDKESLVYFLEADRIALGKSPKNTLKARLAALVFPDYVWKFQVLLRRLEYYSNAQATLLRRLMRLLVYFRYKRLGLRLGFSIPPNVFGPGLSIAHHGTIVVNKGARVGSNCRLHVCVNIGTKAGHYHLAPQIGDNVYIGPGAKIYGDIVLSDGIAVGANAVVNKSFEEANIAIAGVPAGKVAHIDTGTILIKATDQISFRT